MALLASVKLHALSGNWGWIFCNDNSALLPENWKFWKLSPSPLVNESIGDPGLFIFNVSHDFLLIVSLSLSAKTLSFTIGFCSYSTLLIGRGWMLIILIIIMIF